MIEEMKHCKMEMKHFIGKDNQICYFMTSTGLLYNGARGHAGQYNIYFHY